MNVRIHSVLAASLLVCTVTSCDTEDRIEGQNPGECSDGADNDADGLFDCDDPDCAGAPDCEPDTGEEADTDTDSDTDTDTDTETGDPGEYDPTGDAAFEDGQGSGDGDSLDWGIAVGSFEGVVAYSNGHTHDVPGSAEVYYMEYGWQYQCVEYVNRFLVEALGHSNLRGSGNAKDYWGGDLALDQYSNNNTCPQAGDVLVSTTGLYGHVAVVTEVDEDSVTVIQQNWSNNSSDGAYRLSMSRSGSDCYVHPFGDGSYTIAGWLRVPGTVISDCTVQLVSPDGGETLTQDVSYTVEWNSDCSSNVKVEVYKGTTMHQQLAADDANDGELEFTPTSSLFPEGTDYSVCVSTTDESESDCSASSFTIAAASVDADGDGYDATVDCDDADPSVNPGAAESCNDVDDDCDGDIDEGIGTSTYYLDADGDGYGDATSTATDCAAPSGYVSDSSDCDDSDASIHPGATEACNEVDDDCDGAVDESVTSSTYYLDADGDGYGTTSSTVTDCAPPTGYVSDSSDCDDGDASINPGATESCDGEDDNCDGIVDETASCWVAIYRFVDPVTGAHCWNNTTTAPSTCSGYSYEQEAWIAPATGVPDTWHAVQCSNSTDHIIVESGSSDYTALSASYDCTTVDLGYIYDLGSGPASSTTPFTNTCELYRFSGTTSSGSGEHLFTRHETSTSGYKCEPPARGEVLTDSSCFSGTPSGC